MPWTVIVHTVKRQSHFLVKDSNMRLFKYSLAIFALCFCSYSSSDNAISLALDRKISSEGFVTISWDSANTPDSLSLQISFDPSFKKVIRNIKLTNQNRIHLTGFDDGHYYTRLINNDNTVISEVSSFRVKHRQLRNAVILFFIGLTLFVFLIVTLYRFSRKQ